jgi:D-alanyl-D-alanine carboxypeptidase/D-alanyl-D-alanine-endopeptidase (penicillin-binding protein 4)
MALSVATPLGRADAPTGSASAATSATPAVLGARDRLVAAVTEAGGTLGVAVMSLDDGATVAEHHAEAQMSPASNMKLFTAWAALRALGPQHTYLTGLYGRIDGDRVDPLVIAGDGDPGLEMRHVGEMVARLKRAGVARVGDIVVDQSHFDALYVPPAFDAQPHEWAAFRAPVAAVSLAANTLLFEVRAGSDGGAARVSVVPPSFATLSARTMTSARDTPDAVTTTLSVDGAALRAVVGGSIPEGSPTLTYWRRVDDPTLLAGYGLRDACADIGIAVEGKVSAGARGNRPLLSAHRSQPLASLLLFLGKHSNNFYAEMIFKSLADAAPASFDRAARRVEALLDEAHIDRTGMRFRNGSGLFDAGTLTAIGTARMLHAAYRDPAVMPELLASLSIGGVDGTLRHRFTAQRTSRTIRAKTGTLAAVTSLSGYVLGAGDAQSYAFSVYVNDVAGKTVSMRQAIDAFVATLAR